MRAPRPAGRAVRYGRVTLQVYGRSTRRPSELGAAVDRVDGGLEIPGYGGNDFDLRTARLRVSYTALR